MKFMSAREAKNGFGHLIDTARQEPVTGEKHGRPVIVVMSIEEYGRLALSADVPRGLREPRGYLPYPAPRSRERARSIRKGALRRV